MFEVKIAQQVWIITHTKPNRWVCFWQAVLFNWHWGPVDYTRNSDALVTTSELKSSIKHHETDYHKNPRI